MLQERMEGSASWGMLMTVVMFSLEDGGMGRPTSFRRSLVLTLLLPCAKKLCFLYKQNLGLISREEWFWMKARTFNPSPEERGQKCQKVRRTHAMRLRNVSRSLSLLTLEVTGFFKIHLHAYWSWGEEFHLLIFRSVLWRLKEAQTHEYNRTEQQRLQSQEWIWNYMN